MDAKPELKQTGLRVFPKDWEEQRLSSLVVTGPKNGYSGRSSKGARGTPTLSLGATTLGTLVLNDDTVKHLEETIDPNSELFLQSGDVLVQRSNTLDLVGTTAVFEGPSGVYVYPDLMMRIRFRENATAHWFWRYANSANGRRFFMTVAAGSSGSMPKISGDRLRQMRVPVPPFVERRAIATALNDVDALLGGLERLIAKKRDLKQAAMQKLLIGQKRLPGYDGKWEMMRLGDIVSFLKGSGLSKADLALDGKRRCVHYGELFTTYGECITEVLHGTDREESFVYSLCNDVLMPTSDVTPNGLATASCIRVSDAILGGDILIIRPPGEILNGEFLAHLIRANRDQVLQFVSGTTVFHLYGRDMADFCLPAPSAKEQTAIVEVLSDMEAEIAALEARRDKTLNLKQAMMQELLTGKTRLVQPAVADA